MKNWLIKKLGGVTQSELHAAQIIAAADPVDYNSHIKAKSSIKLPEKIHQDMHEVMSRVGVVDDSEYVRQAVCLLMSVDYLALKDPNLKLSGCSLFIPSQNTPVKIQGDNWEFSGPLNELIGRR